MKSLVLQPDPPAEGVMLGGPWLQGSEVTQGMGMTPPLWQQQVCGAADTLAPHWGRCQCWAQEPHTPAVWLNGAKLAFGKEGGTFLCLSSWSPLPQLGAQRVMPQVPAHAGSTAPRVALPGHGEVGADGSRELSPSL